MQEKEIIFNIIDNIINKIPDDTYNIEEYKLSYSILKTMISEIDKKILNLLGVLPTIEYKNLIKIQNNISS